jgi:WD40-like Beta Propeller Repeat
MKPAVLLALTASACGRIGFGDELTPGNPDVDAGVDAPCRTSMWQPVRPLDELDSAATDWSMAFGLGTSQIVFESDRNRRNDFDLFLAERDDVSGRYGAPRELTGLNTRENERAPTLSENGLELYYGGPDGIMRATRQSLNAPFAAPALVVEGGIGPDLGAGDLALVYTSLDGGRLRFMLRSRDSVKAAFGAPPKIIDALPVPDGTGWPSLSSDGLELFYQTGGDTPINTARRPDLASTFASPAPIASLGNGADPDVSSDGQWLLYVTQPSNHPMLAHRTCLDGS